MIKILRSQFNNFSCLFVSQRISFFLKFLTYLNLAKLVFKKNKKKNYQKITIKNDLKLQIVIMVKGIQKTKINIEKLNEITLKLFSFHSTVQLVNPSSTE